LGAFGEGKWKIDVEKNMRVAGAELRHISKN